MPNYQRAYMPGGTYFFTVVTEQRQRILTHPDIRQALRHAINVVRKDMPFQIHGWVLLPDHLHAIWTLPKDDADFSKRWRLIKGSVTQACGDTYLRTDYLNQRLVDKHCGTIWQHRFWEHLIRDEKDFRQHLDYLHFNPLKHQLVEKIADWPWSSFHRYVKEGIYPQDWCNDVNG
jgi:putative transposase